MNQQEIGWRPSAAIIAADAGGRHWRQAVHEQRAATPHHQDFYDLAGALADTLHLLQDLTRVLGGQTANYGVAHALRDDEDEDPIARLADAAGHLGRTRDLLTAAERSAHAYWSAISHIAVEDPS